MLPAQAGWEGTTDADAARRPWRLAGLLFLAYAALVAQFQGIQNILVPIAVARMAPTGKVSTLAALATASAVTTVVAMLIAGQLSDRTRGRWGRRSPWLVGSAILTALSSLVMGRAASVAALMAGMSALWFFANAYQTVLTAILPERVSPRHLGFVSAAMALGVPVGIAAGVNVAVRAPGAIGYLSLSLPMLVATAILVLVEREAPATKETGRLAPASGGLFSSFADRDFALAFLSRFVLFLAYFMVAGYLYYAMSDYVGAARLPGGNVAAAVGTVMTLSTLAWLAVTPLTGFLADRVGHTAGIVGATSIAIGAVMLAPALSNSWWAMIAFGIGKGLAFGIYFAIDLRLVSMVLPSAGNTGRDIGLMSVAGSGPTVFAPALAATIIGHASYPALFLTGAVLALAGGLLAFPIRVRHVRQKG